MVLTLITGSMVIFENVLEAQNYFNSETVHNIMIFQNLNYSAHISLIANSSHSSHLS